jgi:hypothetical protein
MVSTMPSESSTLGWTPTTDAMSCDMARCLLHRKRQRGWRAQPLGRR